MNLNNPEDFYKMSEFLYNKGYSGLDLINYIKQILPNNLYKYKLILVTQKIKKRISIRKINNFIYINFSLFSF